MPVKTITAEINGKVRKITADIPEGATNEQIQAAVSDWAAVQKPSAPATKGFLGTIASDVRNLPGAALYAARHPWETLTAEGQAQIEQFKKSQEAYKRGAYAESINRAVAGLVPFVGPAAAQASEDIATPGKRGQGFARAAEMVLPGPLGKAAKTTLSRAAGLGKVGREIYGAELRLGTKPSLAQRSEMIQRGLKPGEELPISKKALGPLEKEIQANKSVVDQITKADPVYSQRTIPISDLLSPVDKFIERVERVNKQLAKTLKTERNNWAESLGYKPTVAPKTITSPSRILSPQGTPYKVVHTTPGTPGNTMATVRDAQVLKEDIYSVLNSSAYAEMAEPGTIIAGRKLAARGMKRGIEKTVPEKSLQSINHTIENDIRLKDAINSAIKRHPSWVNDWAVFVLGSGLGEAIAGHFGAGAVAVGALVRMAARNPAIMSRLSIALSRTGVALPKLGKVAGPAVTKGTTAGALLGPIPRPTTKEALK